MKRKVDKLLEGIINKHLDKYFYITENNNIRNHFDNEVFGPDQLKEYIMDMFGFGDPNWGFNIIHNWVFENGMVDIENGWHLRHINVEASHSGFYIGGGTGVSTNTTYIHGIDFGYDLVVEPSGSTFTMNYGELDHPDTTIANPQFHQ